MKGFDFVAPKTINEVLNTAKKSKKVKFIAGGTNFLPELRHQHDGPADVVIDLMRVNALRGVNVSKKTTSLGALTTITDLIENKDLNKNAPILGHFNRCGYYSRGPLMARVRYVELDLVRFYQM